MGIGRVDVGGVVEEADAVGTTAGLGVVAIAGHGAAGVAQGRGARHAVGAVALGGVFEACQCVVVGGAEGLAGFDGHGCVRVGGAGEGSSGNFASAAQVFPCTDG